MSSSQSILGHLAVKKQERRLDASRVKFSLLPADYTPFSIPKIPASPDLEIPPKVSAAHIALRKKKVAELSQALIVSAQTDMRNPHQQTHFRDPIEEGHPFPSLSKAPHMYLNRSKFYAAQVQAEKEANMCNASTQTEPSAPLQATIVMGGCSI